MIFLENIQVRFCVFFDVFVVFGICLFVFCFGFGVGFAVRENDGVSVWPGTKGDYYWLGYGGTYFWIDPIEELVAISMTQSVTKRDKINRLMRSLVYQAINE